ncbi:MAG: acyl-CoA ligase (AMP-forming), exosortase A system-associated [Porticoccaceae bacterium]
MTELVHELIASCVEGGGDQPALRYKDEVLDYSRLWQMVQQVASGLLATGIASGERVAVYLPKQIETVAALFGASCAGACFVPINPLLKPRQVSYILEHCHARVLITSAQRLQILSGEIGHWQSVHTFVVVGDLADGGAVDIVEHNPARQIVPWAALADAAYRRGHRRIDGDMAAILYTSGSTGNPKGVVLSHRNIVAGARSVAQYLHNTSSDRILAVLPLSFDAGLSQVTTAFSVGASVVLMDYLLPQDVLRAVVQYRITGLAAVPPLWNQLIQTSWPEEVSDCLRYITNTGGAMPEKTTRTLAQRLPRTDIFLMYGLTEAFRSTYLPPDQVALRPRSIGKAIPNAEILVVNESGQVCGPHEPGELVHRGVLVALGYWNDREKTAERFRPCPGQDANLPVPELAVWSGDQVIMDDDGYLYFVSRKDDMIKTSGYRVSPTEIEEVAYASGAVAAAVAMGIPHDQLGQAIFLIVTPADADVADADAVVNALASCCQKELPSYMQPGKIIVRQAMPHNQNGKIDRRALAAEYLPPVLHHDRIAP